MSVTMSLWVRDEQTALWYDLEKQIQHAANGYWSMGAAYVALRITSAAKLVGPTRWQDMALGLTLGGVRKALYGIVDIEVEDLSPEEIEAARQLWTRTGGTWVTEEAYRLQYAQTIAAMTSDRELAYIRDES